MLSLNEQVSVVRPRRDSSRQQLADLTVGWIPTTLALFLGVRQSWRAEAVCKTVATGLVGSIPTAPTIFVLSRCLGVDWSKKARS